MHIVDSLGKGGLENGLVNVITRLDPRRFEHVVSAIRALGPNEERLPKDRVRVMCLAGRGTSRFQIGTLRRAIHEVSPDIVHSRNWAAIEAVVAGQGFRRPALVHSEHGIETDGAGKEPFRRVVFRRLAYELADRVVAVSGQLRDFHAGRTGFDPKRIQVIHNGVDLGRFRPDPAARVRIRNEMRIAQDDFLIGCVGNLLPVKDHMTLLRALALPEASQLRWRLVIAGEGSERAKLEEFVSANPILREKVSLPGSSTRVPELLNALDLYVLPSVFEGIANSLLEAMATGLPVVASAAGGNPEVVGDGESGVLFPAGDANKLAVLVSELAGNPERRAALASGALGRARERFSIDSMVRRYDELYESTRMDLAVGRLKPAAGENGL